MFELIILSIIQGLTEFIPVSSSAHLILASEYLYINKNNLTLDVSLHIGSFIAIVFYFTKDLKEFLKTKETMMKIFISSLPVAIVGVLLIKLNIINYLRTYTIIGYSTIIFGVLLYICDLNSNNSKKIETDFTYKSAISIGLLQILSLVPGVSRSGIVLTAARFLNYNLIDSAKLSFLTSIPVLFYATGYNLIKIYKENNLDISISNILGIFLSFIFSYLTIRFFLGFLKNFNLNMFVIYRIILGIIILQFLNG